MLDLHVHSHCSDGTMSPAELVAMAGRRGLAAISITDHDTVAGTDEALNAGNLAGITVLSGLELSVTWNEYHLHVLAYDFDWRNERLREALHVVQDARVVRNRKIIARLGELGLPIEESDLEAIGGNGQTGRPHIARLLVERRAVRTIDQAFSTYLRKGASAYVSRHLLSAAEAFSLIHEAGGISVIAHPGQIGLPIAALEQLVTDLQQHGLDGLETYYPTQKGRYFRQLRNMAKRLDLIETGGSDYHGDVRPSTAMAGGRGFTVPSEILTALQRRMPADTTGA